LQRTFIWVCPLFEQVHGVEGRNQPPTLRRSTKGGEEERGTGREGGGRERERAEREREREREREEREEREKSGQAGFAVGEDEKRTLEKAAAQTPQSGVNFADVAATQRRNRDNASAARTTKPRPMHVPK